MITDYIKGISLREYVKQLPNRQVRELTARRIFRQVIEAMAYLHEEESVIHRDIKLDNILIEEGTRMVKLIDFGFSVLTNTPNQRLKVFCGTPSYMAPEITRKSDYEGRPVDIWALGVLLYVMITGQFPFRGVSEQDLYQRIQRGAYRNHELLNGDAKRIVKMMLEVDPK
jgi:serine/threonine protein kinase